jgi:hypothetical protein
MIKEYVEIGFWLSVIIVVISAIRGITLLRSCSQYLLKHHTEKWKELTTVFGFGPGLGNGLRTIKFLFGADYLDDPELLHLKTMCRNWILYTANSLLVSFAMFFWLAVLWTKQQSTGR